MFGTAIFVAVLPGIVITSLVLLPSDEAEVYVVALSAISVLLAQFFRCVVGFAGLLFASNTTWARKVTAAAVFLCACLFVLIRAPLVPDVMRPVTVRAAWCRKVTQCRWPVAASALVGKFHRPVRTGAVDV